MAKYRKRPVMIDAFQMTAANREDNKDWPEWLNEAWNRYPAHPGAVFPNSIGELKISTLEGLLSVSPGDWIIRGVKGDRR